MSLTASMWTGVSGLRGHGQKMGMIGNNIANVSTVGFKGSRMHFEDFMSQNVSVASGMGQVGRGVAVSAIMGDFSQGAMESTNEPTDVAITGNGFFVVRPPREEIRYYTRAGNFRFDRDGFLVNPHGHRVQGWTMRAGVGPVGAPTDIRLENYQTQSPPAATRNVNMIMNLDSRSTPRSPNIWAVWDGTQNPPISDTAYSYQSTLRVFDKRGTGHNLTVYLDPWDAPPAIPPAAAPPPGGRTWRFMATTTPGADQRVGPPPPPPAERGLIQRGYLTFDAGGNLINYGFANAAGAPMNTADMRISPNGHPQIALNFLGETNALGNDVFQLVELNFGLRFTGAPGAAPPVSANWRPDATRTTSYSSPSMTLHQVQDGHTTGFLQNISISREGVLTGRYSNGRVHELSALTLADFHNVWGLRREGGNLFAETRESGLALTGIAGQGRLGTVASNSLELSNVDLATEFVEMITTQRGFQANSRTITTVDMMLDEVIRMRR